MRLAGKIVQLPTGILRRMAGRDILGPCQHPLPLHIKRHRQAKLEFRGWNGIYQREARALPGSRRRHQDIRVNHDLQVPDVSTILISSQIMDNFAAAP